MPPTPRGSSTDGAILTELAAPPSTAPLERFRETLAATYEIGQQVGRGGSADVYCARDLRRGIDVALKVLRPEFSAAVQELRFLREIDVVRSLDHPNVLPLLDSGSAEGQVYFAMPLLKGHTLADHLHEHGPLPIDRIIAISRDIARALDYAHSKGVIHRDIKPSNTLLEDDRAYVTDFGIARAVRVASGDELTDSGISIGTPEYMSPEQAAGSRQLDARCDVYALGCVVYHMLSGAPPFTGPNNQAIIARHCHEPPPPLHVVRPTISEAMVRVVERALAKVPADRFATAGEFVTALEEAADAPPVARRAFTLRRLTIAAAAVVASVAALWFTRIRNAALDPNRIVVFPLSASGLKPDEPSGEAVATAIGYTLEGTQPLRWIDGWELLDNGSRNDKTRITPSEARRLSRKAHAGYFIYGSMIGAGDTVTVALQLSSVARDSVIARSSVTEGAGAFVPSMGLRAVTQLMIAHLQPKEVDVSPLNNRNAVSFLNFLQGEDEYRRMQFSVALNHFKTAVRGDSSFALAALRGAQAAEWLSRVDQDSALVEVAFSHEASLPLLEQMITRGLRAYVIGNADSAVYYFERALKIEPASRHTWTLLGEVYARMLPSNGPADSLAEHAFLRAREIDADFAPALVHLERIALVRRDTAAARRFETEIKAANADSSHAFERDLMVRCVQRPLSAAEWNDALRRDMSSVLGNAKLFSVRVNRPDCSRAALQALLRADTSVVSLGWKWASLLLLDGIDVAVASPNTEDIRARVRDNWPLLALRGNETLDLDDMRRRTLDSLAAHASTLRTKTLWYLTQIALRLRDTTTLASMNGIVALRADSSRSRLDRLVAATASAKLSLLRGDSAGAIKQLQALEPTARRDGIRWDPWESLGAERMLLAEVLFAHGDARGAIRVATLIDAPEPAAYLYWLRPSLELRARAADALRDTHSAKSYRARLSQLDLKAARVAKSRPTQ